MKKFIKKNYIYFITPLIATLLLLIIFSIKEITPFGSNNIIEADFGQSYVSLYYYLKDVLFGSKSMLWTFNYGSGFMYLWIVASNALLSPLNLILAFVNTSNMLNFMPIFLLTKIVLMSLTMAIFIKKTFLKVNNVYTLIFSLLYAFSGYVLLSFHNIIWFDSLVYFPLLVLATLHLFKNKKVIPFIILLSLELISSYYIGYMIVLTIITCGSIYIYYYVPKEDKKEVMLKGLLGVISSCLIALPAVFPVLMATQESYRYLFLGGGTTTNDILTKINFYLISMLLVIIPFYYLYNNLKNKDNKNLKYWILTIIPLMSGLIIEKYNLIWHGGSYVMFPYRYGFIPLFFLLCFTISYFNKDEKKIKKDSKDYLKLFLVVIMFIITIVIANNKMSIILNYDISTGMGDKTVFSSIFIISLCFMITYIITMLIKNKNIKKYLLLIIIFGEIIVNGVAYIGRDEEVITNYDYKTNLLKNAEAYHEKFNLNIDNLDRFKDTTATLNENYAYAMNVPTIAAWTQLITYDQITTHQLWGYGTRYTRIQDLGGTIFSDAFYHTKYVLSNKDLPSNLYNQINNYGQKKLYETKTLPIGIIHNNYNVSKDVDNSFEFQNNVYKMLFDQEDDIVNIIEPNFKQNDNYYTMTIDLKNNSYLYLDNNGLQYYITKIIVDDNVVYIPYVGDEANTYYPHVYNNGIVDLGCYKGRITIELETVNENINNEITLGYIDENKYLSLFEEFNYDIDYNLNKNTMTLNVNDVEKDKYLLLPITYFEGIEVYVNNNLVTIDDYLDNYINIPLVEGNNKIKINFYPKYYKLSLLVSIITILLIIIVSLLNKKYHFDKNKIILNISYYVFIICAICTFGYMYIYSLFK